uniref:Sarcolemmal membrane-associated protein (inferred by orthology to a human protein) n=1 Tax=Strongyloides venezuelensis TaxID=75913 RepID=A0A0K0EWW5_STRVS
MSNEELFYIVLSPCVESFPFEERMILLPSQQSSPIIVGRNLGHLTSSKDNAIFHCKVLSRNHAYIWFDDGKCYIRDTKSSNGTFVNGVKLQSQNSKTSIKQLFTGDIVQFGVEILDYENKVISPCIIAYVKFANKFGCEIEVTSKSEQKVVDDKITLCENKIKNLSNNESQKIFELQQFIKEVVFRENILTQKLEALEEALLATTKAAESSWTSSVNEKTLLSRIQRLECKVALNENKYPSNSHQKCSLNESKKNIDETLNEILKKQKEFEVKVNKQLEEFSEKLLNLTKKTNDIYDKMDKQQKQLNDNEELCKLNNLTIDEINARLSNHLTVFEIYKKSTDYKFSEISSNIGNIVKNEFKSYTLGNKININFDETDSQSESVNSIIPCHFPEHKDTDHCHYRNKSQQYQRKVGNENSEFSDGSLSSLSPYVTYKYLKKPHKKNLVYRFSSISERSLFSSLRKRYKKHQKEKRRKKLKFRDVSKKTKYYGKSGNLNKNTFNCDFSFDILMITLLPLIAIFSTLLMKFSSNSS